MAVGHISSALDSELADIEQLVVRMGDLVEYQLDGAVKALLAFDTSAASEIRAADKQVDELEVEISNKVVRLIALRQPAAADLRHALATLKIASDLERVGDYARNIATRTQVLSSSESIGDSLKVIEKMCYMVRGMIKSVLTTYTKHDADAANEVRASDTKIDEIYNELFRSLLTSMTEDSSRVTPCLHLLFIARNVERMGDFITSIAEQVYFSVHGELPPDEREKVDVTSTIDSTGLVIRVFF